MIWVFRLPTFAWIEFNKKILEEKSFESQWIGVFGRGGINKDLSG